jgi:hypothetical protein
MAFTVGNQKENLFSKLKNMMPAKRIDTFRSSQARGGASPFSMLTPTEFAELFPKYYLKQKPDVRGFFDALSTRKRQGGEAGATGDSTANVSTGEKVTNTVRAKEIYDYLKAKGIDSVHAAGIVNNMKYESTFDSGAIGDGGTSGGLFQHHASRFTAMKNYVGDDWKTNWKKQIDFALTESDMKTYLGRNFANARDASMGFTSDFERPANTAQTAAYRARTADGYASAMEGRGGEPAGGQTPGGNYTLSTSGSIVPRDRSLYDSGNEEQCATLSKGFNPDIGRSSTWTVVPGQIKPGVVVATMRYNLPGGDRTGSGYHTGVALSAPDEKGNFLLLDQSNGNAPKVRTVNSNSYSGGSMGGKTSFGLISSGGRLHDEQSLEALKFAADRAGDDETRKKIMSNYEAVTKGAERGPETGGSAVTVNENPNVEGVPGPQSNLQQQEAVKSIQTASVGDMFRMVGDLAGFFNRGEGLGDSDEMNFVADASFQRNSEVLIRRLMKDYNLKPLQAAGIVGNLASESNVRGQPLTAGAQETNKKKGRGGLGWGQWTGERRKDFVKFAAQYGKEKNIKNAANDPEVNYQFLKKEFDSTQKHVIENVRNAKTLEQATYQGLTFEKPGWSLNHTGQGKHKHTSMKSYDEVSSMKSADGGQWQDRVKFAKETAGYYDTAERQRADANELASNKPEPPKVETATVKPVSRFQELYDNARMYIDKARGGLYGESFARNKPKAAATPAPSVMDKTPTQNLPPGVYSGPEELDKNMMTPEPMTKDKQSFNMNQIPSERQQTPTVIDKFMERKSAEFSSPSLERHAFTIRQQQPTIGANYMHMNTDTA